jgi:nucleoside-diphosphate-sugar epimerase
MIIRPQTKSLSLAKRSSSRERGVTRALITGATGFSGKYLIRLLESENVAVSTLSLRSCELTNTKRITEELEKAQPDYLFHLAGIATGNSAEEFFRINVLYATKLFRASQDANLMSRPILLVGTAAEYGRADDEDLPLRETTPCRPYNYYGMSKLMQTLAGLSEAESENRSIVVARPFNIVGRGMPAHLALGSFARQLAEIKAGVRRPILEVGNLGSRRDLIDVEDVVRLYWKLIRCEGAYGKVFNLCTGVATATGDALDLLIKASGLPVRVESTPSLHKDLDMPISYGSNQKLQRLIGDFEYTPLEQTIKKIAP